MFCVLVACGLVVFTSTRYVGVCLGVACMFVFAFGCVAVDFACGVLVVLRWTLR